MKKLLKLFLILDVFVVIATSAKAEPYHHHGGHHRDWRHDRRALRNETIQRKAGDILLNQRVDGTVSNLNVTNANLTSETNNRISQDQALNSQINTEAQARSAADSALNARQNSLQHQIDEANETKIVGDLALQVYDGKRVAVQLFNAYDFRAGHNFMAGTRIVLKLGKSYADKVAEAQDRQLLVMKDQLIQLEKQLDAVSSHRASTLHLGK